MKKLLLYTLFAGSASLGFAQTVIFEDSFEDYTDFTINNFGNWIGIDVDGLNTYSGGGGIAWDNEGAPQAFQIFNPSVAEVTNDITGVEGETRNFDPRTGLKYAACWAAVLPGNNDWMISPEITLGASGNELSFYVKSMSDSYGLERYKVAIYAGSGVPTAGDFTYLAGNPDYLEAPYDAWEEVVIGAAALDAYNGQTVRFAIQSVTVDAYMLMVDDFSVTTTAVSSASELLASKFEVFPNPANDVLTISSNNEIAVEKVEITDLNGRVIMNVSLENTSANTSVNVAELNTGVYLVNITTSNGVVVKSIVKN